MKNNSSCSSGDYSFTKTIIATGLATALSWPVLAEEWLENNPALLSSVVESITTQVQSDITNTLFQEPYSNSYYNARNNTIYIIPEKKESFQLNETKELEQKRDIETFFLFDLDMFNAVYWGDLSIFNTSSEVVKLLKVQDDFLEIQKNTIMERDLKIINRELLKISARITKTKEDLSVQYIDSIIKEIDKKLPTYEEKLRYIERFDEESPNLANFLFLFHGVLSKSSENISEAPYVDIVYFPETAIQGIVSKTSEVDEKKYTEEQKQYYTTHFIGLKDVHNIEVLSKSVNESTVLKYLADINNDGKISNRDVGIFSGLQLFALFSETESQMIAEWKEKEFYLNLSFIFELVGIKSILHNRLDLVHLLQSNPLAKLWFRDALVRFNISGTDIGYILRYGLEGIQKWESVKMKISADPLVGKLFSKIYDGTKNLGTEISRLKSEGIITDKEYDTMINELQKTLNHPKFSEQVMTQTLNLLSGFSAMYFSSKYGGMQVGYSKQSLNLSHEAMKQFIDSVELSTGIYNTNDGNMLMLGLAYKGKKQISETSALDFSLGVNFGFGSQKSVLPIMKLGHISKTNSKELKDAGIADFQLDEKSFKIWGSFSMINTHSGMVWLGIGWNSDRKWAIEKKAMEFSKLLDEVFACDVSKPLETCMQFFQKTLTSPGYEKISALWDLLFSTESRLRTLGFDGMKIEEKRRIIEDEKSFYFMKFLHLQASMEEENGWNVSGFGIGLSIIAKMVGIPFLPGVEISKLSMKYSSNQAKKTMGILMQQKEIWETLVLSKDNSSFAQNLETILGVDGLKMHYKDGYLNLVSNEPNLLKSLSKNGVEIRIAISKKILSHISYKNGVFNIGNVERMSSYRVLTPTGKKVIITIGDNKWTKRTESLNPRLIEILAEHKPEPLTKNIEITHGTITEQQVGNLRGEKFDIGVF